MQVSGVLTSEIVVIVSYRALPGRSETAASEIADLVAAVLAHEPLCGGIEVLRESSDPARIVLIERWPSREHFLGPHMEEPHIRSFIERAAAFVAGPPEISFWEVVDPGKR